MQLTVQGVDHHYGALEALTGIDLTIGSGELVALVGPSGCGKSTLLSILGGLLAPTRGEVRQSGAVPDGCLVPITYVFQDFSLLPWRTVEGNVDLVLEDRGLGSTERRERIEAVLAKTKLSDFRGALPKQLSGGMRQRVGIARALAANPAVLLMDEPLSALDAQTRTLLLEDFAELFRTTPVTGVYVTHTLSEAVRLANRIVVLRRRPGAIKEILPVEMPLDDRSPRHPDLLRLEERLWELIRDEAVAADRELDHG